MNFTTHVRYAYNTKTLCMYVPILVQLFKPVLYLLKLRKDRYRYQRFNKLLIIESIYQSYVYYRQSQMKTNIYIKKVPPVMSFQIRFDFNQYI